MASKKTFDVQIDHPVIFPAPFPGFRHGLMGRFSWPIPIGVGKEKGLHHGLETQPRGHLRDSIRNRRYSQRSCSSALLRNLHPPHRLWMVAARGHPIPELVEIFREIPVELLKRLSIDPCCPIVCPYKLVCLPYESLRNVKRFCLFHSFILLPVGVQKRHEYVGPRQLC